MKKVLQLLTAAVLLAAIAGCDKDKKDNTPKLIFKFKFDPTQERLGNLGNPQPLPTGHAGQSPVFNAMSAHYIELAQGPLTALGQGAVLYRAPEVSTGGNAAIDFDKSTFAKDGEMFFEVPLSEVAKGDYEYLRVSLAYQNYDVSMLIDTTIYVSGVGNYDIYKDVPCTVASFIGFNTYITSYKIKDETIAVNANRAQGYWGFEFKTDFYGVPYQYKTSGQAPAGATTVVNPIQATSPIPPGSCLVTGPFSGGKLRITGNETEDVVVTVSLSTNKSFEWEEVVNDGKWEPLRGEKIVDMGIRGMVPSVVY
jgi:hypothetical protein